MKDLKITRRVFLGGLGASAIVVTAPVLASVVNADTGIQQVTKAGQFFTANELTVLVDVAEIMIPRTDTPGATDVHVMPVLDAMMLTWAGDSTKSQFKALVQQIEQLAKNSFEQEYIQLDQASRNLLISELDKRAFANTKTDLSENYREFKELVFHIYYTSEEANPDYKVIPGGYRGDITKLELIEINKRGYL
ncbi:twin-arginine translocation pathway signal [Catenovulum agarivorans DS-2]|uniref:Twin-arginine translocation pathway signal n=1 Tax=Catenovulum agarivorans DS-2 TaxID=1328313 RepID=W7QIQ4_9ALTE|nr:gluconate 2-dehydrogenase subunit 3 family protein [Catenovulum agarivorans]EWH08812.1 twin-arginine translocation pathway signal [Catenovulum agarivorans DS-2]